MINSWKQGKDMCVKLGHFQILAIVHKASKKSKSRPIEFPKVDFLDNFEIAFFSGRRVEILDIVTCILTQFAFHC